MTQGDADPSGADLAAIDEAVALDASSSYLHYARAKALGDLGRHEDALASVDEAIRLDGSYPHVH